MKNEYIISDIDIFCESIRILIFNSFGKDTKVIKQNFSEMMSIISPEDKLELDSIISAKECKNIVVSMLSPLEDPATKQISYFMNNDLFASIIDSVNSRFVSNILSNLCKKGVIDSAYDSEMNDFVFWVKEDVNKKTNPDQP